MSRRTTDLLRATYAERQAIEAIGKAEAGDTAHADLAHKTIGYRTEDDGSIRALLKEKARRNRTRANQRRAKPRGEWDSRTVLARLVEALHILRHAPVKDTAASIGSAHPEIIKTADDIWLEQIYALQLEEEEIARMNRRRRPTAAELARMEEALSWPMRFLAAYPLACAVIWAEAYERAFPPPKDAPPEPLTPSERALVRMCRAPDDADRNAIPAGIRPGLLQLTTGNSSPRLRRFLRETYRRGLSAIVQELNRVDRSGT